MISENGCEVDLVKAGRHFVTKLLKKIYPNAEDF